MRGEAQQGRRVVQPEIELHVSESKGQLTWPQTRGLRHLPASSGHDYQPWRQWYVVLLLALRMNEFDVMHGSINCRIV